MFHFISTPLIQVPHNPNWIMNIGPVLWRVLPCPDHARPQEANTSRIKWRGRRTNGRYFSPQISPRATADSSAARTASASQPGGGATDTRWHNNMVNISKYSVKISILSIIYYLYYLYFPFQDCTDGTDESNCTAVSCPDDKFNCPQVRHYASLQPGHVHTVMWSRGTCCATLSVATRALLRNPALSDNVATRYQVGVL